MFDTAVDVPDRDDVPDWDEDAWIDQAIANDPGEFGEHARVDRAVLRVPQDLRNRPPPRFVVDRRERGKHLGRAGVAGVAGDRLVEPGGVVEFPRLHAVVPHTGVEHVFEYAIGGSSAQAENRCCAKKNGAHPRT